MRKSLFTSIFLKYFIHSNAMCRELKLMAGRITAVRTALRDALIAISCPTPSSNYSRYTFGIILFFSPFTCIVFSWDHIVNQIGMFAYTGLEVGCVANYFSLFYGLNVYIWLKSLLCIFVCRPSTLKFLRKNGTFIVPKTAVSAWQGST